MKRYILRLAAVLLCMNLLLSAAAAVDSSTRIDYADGSYAIVTMSVSRMARASVADSKSYTYYDPLGQKCFTYTLYATFSYDGSTSRADTVSFDIDIYRSDWDIVSHNEYTSGNCVYGSAIFSGPNGQHNASLYLRCDANGNVT